jgi:hypothetical protein
LDQSQPQASLPNSSTELATTGTPANTSEEKLVMIDRILDLQKQELKLREREADLEENNQTRAYDYSVKVLAAQERDRVHDREHNRKSAREKMIGVCVLVGIILAVALISMRMGNKDFALDLLKYFGTFTAGGAFGFGVKAITDNKKKLEPDGK